MPVATVGSCRGSLAPGRPDGGGTQPIWRRDGKELFYMRQDGRLVVVPIVIGEDRIVPGEPMVLFQTRARSREPGVLNRQYDVSRDGSRMIISTATDRVTPITLLVNWPRLLER